MYLRTATEVENGTWYLQFYALMLAYTNQDPGMAETQGMFTKDNKFCKT